MTEVRQGTTPRVRFREVSVKRELNVFSFSSGPPIKLATRCATCILQSQVTGSEVMPSE